MISRMEWTDQTRSTLRAAIDRIIPPDEFSGAWDAGVGQYIEQILRTDLRDSATAFGDGLAALDAEALALNGRAFASLDESHQDVILQAVERGDVPAPWPTPPKEFFALLVNLTAEGFYGDPANGGNRQMISWKMIGYEPRGQTP
jgi:hypothetical protein